MMENVLPPQALLEMLAPAALTHKNWRVRQLVLECFEAATSRYVIVSPHFSPFSFGMAPSKFLPSVARLLGDPNESVREQTFSVLVEFYRVMGDRMRTDLAQIDGVFKCVCLLFPLVSCSTKIH